jgi:energy-coupling factor transporter ATP-binding protein EcfA2
MRLESVKYSEFEGSPQEWTLEGLRLGARNLLVGRNATGKTRVLNVISGLASQLAGSTILPLCGHYEIEFAHEGKNLRYEVKFDEQKVVLEKFSFDGEVVLDRHQDGAGEILAEAIDGERKTIRFQTPPSTLAAVARRDAIQHTFLEPLHVWASSLRLFSFGSPLGKDQWAVYLPNASTQFDEKNPNQVVQLFRQAEKEFNGDFKDKVLGDMRKLDYDLKELEIGVPVSIRVFGLPGELVGLSVKENGLTGITDQHSMSQGMFRALSLLIQLNYSQLSTKATCILIDDIGEGLDFQRSCQLIDLLRQKAERSDIQIILSTNDRFVMNSVPLEEWSVLQRQGGRVKVRNYDNSREVFEEFKFTGLSNFSFLEMDFISGPPAEETPANA